MKKCSLYLVLLFISVALQGQNASLSGVVSDHASGKTLLGVHVVLLSKLNAAEQFLAVTNIHGMYRFETVPAGNYVMNVSHVGYARFSQEISLVDDEQTVADIILEEQEISLVEVIVTSLRTERFYRDQPLPLSVITANAIENSHGFSLTDHLSREPGMALASDGVWGTSLNIRGMSEERIVSLIDGNRIETATDLSAALSLVDVFDIERVEVIKGAASSLYGSGAMGGVVNIITRQGFFSDKPHLGGTLSSSFSTVNDLYSGHLSVIASAPRLYTRITSSYRHANDIMTPAGVLTNSQFSDRAVSLKFGVQPAVKHQLHMAYQLVEGEDIGIPGGKVFPVTAIASYPRETREMISGSWDMVNLLPSLEKTSISFFHQYILRDVLMYPNTPPSTPPGQRITPLKLTPTGYHNTSGMRLQTDWRLPSGNKLIAGMDYWQRKLETEREKHIRMEMLDTEGQVVAVNSLVRGEVPVPTSFFRSGGLFIQDEVLFLDQRLSLTAGARADLVRINSDEARDPLYTILNGVRNDNPANQRITFPGQVYNGLSWSANLGLLFRLSDRTDLTANVARSFRSPSLEERFKYIDLGSTVRLGDPQLSSENGYFFDLGARFTDPTLHASINAFLNRMEGLIVEVPGDYIYTYFTGEGDPLVDTLPALINANVDEAMLFGFDLNAEWSPVRRMVMFAQLSYVRGINTLNDTDLPAIPPMHGITGLKYHLPGIAQATCKVFFAADQNKVAQGEVKTHGYARYDLYLQSDPLKILGTRTKILAGVENLTNRTYSNHLSTNRGLIDTEPGRNFFIRFITNW